MAQFTIDKWLSDKKIREGEIETCYAAIAYSSSSIPPLQRHGNHIQCETYYCWWKCTKHLTKSLTFSRSVQKNFFKRVCKSLDLQWVLYKISLLACSCPLCLRYFHIKHFRLKNTWSELKLVKRRQIESSQYLNSNPMHLPTQQCCDDSIQRFLNV